MLEPGCVVSRRRSSDRRQSLATSTVEHMSVTSSPAHRLPTKLTHAVCTIGPASDSVPVLEQMIVAGMDVARINLSYGDHNAHRRTIQRVREAAANVAQGAAVPVDVSIALDTKGPEIRTGENEKGGSVLLEYGAQVTITTDKAFERKGSSSLIYVDYEDLPAVVEHGLMLYLDNSTITLAVESVADREIRCQVVSGGSLGPRKNVTGQNIFRRKPDLTLRDVADIEFAILEKVDCILVSYTMVHDTIVKVKHIINDSAAGKPLVFAKIRNKVGAKNLPRILEVADGIMIARSDIAVEVPLEQVFTFQRSIVSQGNIAGKPVICGSQMLNSLVNGDRVSRADTFDVANSILDGFDCLLLSEETAIGRRPAKSVEALVHICREAELAVWTPDTIDEVANQLLHTMDVSETVAFAAVETAFNCQAKVMIVLATSGRTARLMSKYRPPCPVIVITRNAAQARSFRFYRAIIPLYYEKPANLEWVHDIEHRWKYGVVYAKGRSLVDEGDFIVVITGWSLTSGLSNTMKIEIVN